MVKVLSTWAASTMWGNQKSNVAASANWLGLSIDFDYLILLIGLHWLMDCWGIFLYYRQVGAIKRAIIPPPQLIGKIDLAAYKAKRKTAISRNIFMIVLLTATLVIKSVKLGLSLHAFVWDMTAHYSDVQIHRAAWFAAFDELFDDLTLLPFYLSASFLFKKRAVSFPAIFLQTIIHMFFDTISAAQSLMFLVWLTDCFGAQALFILPLILNIFGLVFQSIFIHNYVPTIFQTLLSATTDQQLKADLVIITSGVNYPVDRIYVDGRSPEANAYFMGIFGANMIAVSPELMRIMNGRSVAASVVHELGHWAHHHNNVLLTFALASVLCFSYGWFFAYDNSIVNHTFRFKVTPQAMIPVTLWIKYVSTLSTDFIAGINSFVGCWCEYTADAFAVPRKLGSALKDCLIALAANARNFPFSDTWYSAWYTHHPTIMQRIKRLDKMQPD